MNRNPDRNPFTPGSPVPPDLFVGRTQQLQEVTRYIDQAVAGRLQNVFLSGDRGMGKSSFAAYLRQIAIVQNNMVGVHTYLGGVTSLEDLVRRVLDGVLRETREQDWFERISGLFGDRIQQVGMFGVSVKFDPPREDLTGLARNFPEALGNLVASISERKSGLILVLDDINGLADTPYFAHWYKSFADSVATHFGHFPVLVLVVGTTDKWDALAAVQPSLMRVFRPVDVPRLTDEDVTDFFVKAFGEAGMEIEEDALSVLELFADGLPILMQEIGDAVFWEASDDLVREDDARKGIIRAAENVGTKYLDPVFYRTVRSARYRSIVRKMMAESPRSYFTRSEVRSRINEDERRVFDNLLRRLRELGIVEQDVEEGRGAYRFVNALYPVYMYMESSLHD